MWKYYKCSKLEKSFRQTKTGSELRLLPIPLVEPSERQAVRRIKRHIHALEEVEQCREVRMSFTRKKPHVYVHVWLRGNPDYETIHRICSTIEVVVRVIVPNARVAVRSEPSVEGTEEAWYLVKKIAEEESGSRGAHNIHLKNAGETLGVDFVLEVSADMNLRQAHDVSARIEKRSLRQILEYRR